MHLLASLNIRNRTTLDISLTLIRSLGSGERQSIRTYYSSLRRDGLSDPFKPSSKKSTQDTKAFYEEKLKNIKSTNGLRMQEPSDNLLTRMIKRSLNPTPLNTNLREKFKLDKNYKLVYLVDKERMHLIVFGAMNALMPLLFLMLGGFAYAEFTGQSQMSKSFENPYLFVATVAVYFGFVFTMSRLAQVRTVFRIYYNEATEKFVLIRLKGVANFEAEPFTSRDVQYRMPNKHQETFWQNIQKAQVPTAIEKMIGTKAYNCVKLEMKDQGPAKKRPF